MDIIIYNRWIDLIIQPYKCLVIQDLISQRSLHGNQGDTNTPTPQIHTTCFAMYSQLKCHWLKQDTNSFGISSFLVCLPEL